MSDPAVRSLRDALGVSRSIRVSVRGPSHLEPAVSVIDAPFAIIGRGSACDISLTDRSVSFRHVYLQAFGDRLFCQDLLSQNPVIRSGPDTHGWWSADQTIDVGPYTLHLVDDGWATDFAQWPSPLECKTRTDKPTPFGNLPHVHLELLNPQFRGMTWPINRVLTLVGRDERCRITCADEGISRVHCSLLLTPYGLWAIDLLGRGGIQVNGETRRCARLADGDELHIGRYAMKAAYETPPQELPSASTTQPDTAELKIPPEILSAEETLPSPEFLTRNNKIFPATICRPVMIVEPRGGIRSAAYQEIQLESNIITQLLKTRSQLPHLVVDIYHADAMDSIMINSIMAMCRAAKGKAAICNGAETMLTVLNDMNLTKVWPHFATREEALQYVSAG